MKQVVHTVRTHWIFFFILIIASILRLYQGTTSVIFIGDQARDFFVAKRMVTDGTIPLLGIPSSIPRFSQGPLFIYITAFMQSLFGFDPSVMALCTAIVGILCVPLIYLLMLSNGKKAALIAAALFALSPLAILHARMPWVLSFIPFFCLLYMHMVMQTISGKRFAPFWAAFFFGCLFQMELATAPLLILLLYGMWRARYTSNPHGSIKKPIILISVGLFLGLLPEIIHDLTHGFTQLGGFSTWVFYRITTAFLPGTDHSLFTKDLLNVPINILTMCAQVFTLSQSKEITIVWTFFLSVLCIYAWHRRRRLSDLGKLSLLATVVLAVAFCIHRAPSDAYIPGIIIPLILIISIVLAQIPKLVGTVCTIICLAGLSLSVYTILTQQFFLARIYENNWQQKIYGPSLAAQKQMIDEISGFAGRECIRLFSYERQESFPTLLSHFEYLLSLEAPQQNRNFADCKPIAIDRTSYTKLSTYYGADAFALGMYTIQKQK